MLGSPVAQVVRELFSASTTSYAHSSHNPVLVRMLTEKANS
jgi:hypothetical protein